MCGNTRPRHLDLGEWKGCAGGLQRWYAVSRELLGYHILLQNKLIHLDRLQILVHEIDVCHQALPRMERDAGGDASEEYRQVTQPDGIQPWLRRASGALLMYIMHVNPQSLGLELQSIAIQWI